jgi:hypothetical protein
VPPSVSSETPSWLGFDRLLVRVAERKERDRERLLTNSIGRRSFLVSGPVRGRVELTRDSIMENQC